MKQTVVLFANTAWYLFNFRRSLAVALRDAGFRPLLLSPPDPYGEKLRDLGLEWMPLPMDRRSLNPLREARLVVRLASLFRRERPVLVHGFTIKCAVYGALAARLAGVRARVSSVAGMGYVFTNESVRARLLRPIVRASMRLAMGGKRARVILQNPDDLEAIEGMEIVPSSHLHLIPGSGVDCVRFCPPVVPRVRGDRFRVLLMSRLLFDKGIREYVAAARILREQEPTCRLLLAGDVDPGNPSSIPKAEVEGWVSEGVIDWLGHVDDMPALFASVDAAVLPSYREGLPKGLIEAAACGLPLVTTDVPGCREVVEHGVDGLLVPARDAARLADAISELARDPILAQRLGRAARTKAQTRFDEGIVVGRTIEVYRELIDP